MAKHAYWAYGRTGGASGDLDAINGNLLADQDAFVYMPSPTGLAAFYTLDASYDTAENSPYTLRPDTNPGTKNLRMLGFQAASADFTSLYVSGQSEQLGHANFGSSASFDGNVYFDSDIKLYDPDVTATGYWDTTHKHASISLSDSNKVATSLNTTWKSGFGDDLLAKTTTGKYYFDVEIDDNTSTWSMVGIGTTAASTTLYLGQDTNSWCYASHSGFKRHAGSPAAFGATWTSGDVIGVAVDFATGRVWFAKNNVWQDSGDPAAGTNPAYQDADITNNNIVPGITLYGTNDQGRLNIMSGDMTYSPPSGFSAWDSGISSPIHLNFGTTIGTTGYGIKDDGTDLQFKPSGGDWDNFQIDSSEITVNEGGDDIDFRVEASGEANALFVQGSDGAVGIGTGSPGANLHLYSETTLEPLILIENQIDDAVGPEIRFFKDSTGPGDGDDLGTINWYGRDSAANSQLYVSIIAESFDVTSTDEAGRLTIKLTMDATSRNFLDMAAYTGVVNQGSVVINEDGQDVDFRVESSLNDKAISVDGATGYVQFFDGIVLIGQGDTQYGYLGLLGQATGSTAGGYLDLATAFDHDTYLNSYNIKVVEDDFTIGPVGADDLFKMVGGGDIAHDVSEVVFNESGNDVDFRVESAVSSQSLFIDGASGDLYIYNAANQVMHLDVSLAILWVGQQDVDAGQICALGRATGGPTGGGFYAYTAADHDSYINYYGMAVTSDDLQIGPPGAVDLIKLQGGGDIAHDCDAVIINEAGNDVDFRVESALAENAILMTGSDGSIRFAGAAAGGVIDAYIGVNDSVQGRLNILGNNANSGATILMYQPANDDGVVDYYRFNTEDGNLTIGPNTDTDALKLDSNKDLYLTDGDLYIQNGTAGNVAQILVGAHDSVTGRLYLYGNNSDNGAAIYMYEPANDDAVVNYYVINTEDGNLYIGPNTDTDALKYDGGNNRWDFTTWIKNTYVAYDDLRVPVNQAGIGAGGTNPGWGAFQGNVEIRWFDASSMEELFFCVQMPHSWKAGSNITPHVHWTPAASEDGAVRCRWGLEYEWHNIDELFEGTTTIYTQSTTSGDEDTRLIADKHYMSNFAAIDGTGRTISSMLVCRIFRDATATYDSLASDAGLFEVDFHYQVDSFGSDAITTKS